MTESKQVPFDTYLDIVFAMPNWHDGCVTMLSTFLEDIDTAPDDVKDRLPAIAPSIVDQVVAIANRAQRLENYLRDSAQARGPEFQTNELGAVLWWAGMAVHKATAAAQSARDHLAGERWEDAFFEIHSLLFNTTSAISLLAIAQGMLQRLEAGGIAHERPN